MPRLIRLTSRALGHQLRCRVLVYDTREEMLAAARAFSRSEDLADDIIGVTQARVYRDGRTHSVLVRLWRKRLSTEVICHEMHHASTALYGGALPPTVSTYDFLNHFNEDFAHLHSDLVAGLVDRLHDLGYYD